MQVETVLNWAGHASLIISAIFAVAVFIVAAFAWIRGIGPALFRLGNGLAHRKIAVFAKGDTAADLRNLLADTALFRSSNIIEVGSESSIERAEGATLFLVHWPDWTDDKEWRRILSLKRDGHGLIVYAPQDKGRIPDNVMAELNSRRNVVVANLRGRLLNDVLVSLITTKFDKA